MPDTIEEQVARRMLERYSSATVALEMAFWHAMDHPRASHGRDHWLRVRDTMARLAKEKKGLT